MTETIYGKESLITRKIWTSLSINLIKLTCIGLYTWTSPDGPTEIRLITFFAAKDGEAPYSQQKKKTGANCGSDHELLIVKFRLKLKKVGKTTRPFRHDLNQIPYDYTVEVRNSFNRLNLIEGVKNYGWTLYRRQWSTPTPRKGNAKGQSGCLRRPYK